MSGVIAALLIGEQRAGAAHAGLHLVEDQQQPVAVAELAHSPQVAGVGGHDAALALDGLEHDGDGPRRDRRRPAPRASLNGDVAEALPAAAESRRRTFSWPVAAIVARVRPWNESERRDDLVAPVAVIVRRTCAPA